MNPTDAANAFNIDDTTATGRTASGAGSATDGTTTAAIGAALAVALASGLAFGNTVAATDDAARAPEAPSWVESLPSPADTDDFASGLTFFTAPEVVLPEGCDDPPDFFVCGCVTADVSELPSDSVAAEAVPVAAVAPVGVAVEAVVAEPGVLAAEVGGLAEASEVESLAGEPFASGVAHAVADTPVTAEPIPSATANAPTRPMCFAYPMMFPRRSFAARTPQLCFWTAAESQPTPGFLTAAGL